MGFLKTLVGMALDIAQGRSWSFETAEFTGVCKDKDNNVYDKFVPEGVVITEYEIRYYVFGKGNRQNWYTFPHGETPDPAELAGATMEIRYDDDSPLFYDVVGEVRPRSEGKPPRHFRSPIRIRIS